MTLKERYPLTDALSQTVIDGRREITRILDKQDQRLLVVVGPCSIHEPKAAFGLRPAIKRVAPRAGRASLHCHAGLL